MNKHILTQALTVAMLLATLTGCETYQYYADMEDSHQQRMAKILESEKRCRDTGIGCRMYTLETLKEYGDYELPSHQGVQTVEVWIHHQ